MNVMQNCVGAVPSDISEHSKQHVLNTNNTGLPVFSAKNFIQYQYSPPIAEKFRQKP